MIKKLKPAWVDEFKKFALKGNVVDMAVGVIIGGAFGKIVTSLVNDIIMPAVSMLTGDTKNLAELTYSLSAEEGAPVITGDYAGFCAEHDIKVATGGVCIFTSEDGTTWTCTEWGTKAFKKI